MRTPLEARANNMSLCHSFCLNNQYSTTRIVTKEQTRIENRSSSKLQRQLFLPSLSCRLGEGGLRTQGYFKTDQNHKPLVTIITIVYNRREYIAQTIESVLRQTYENVEYIIIDGGSTDGTTEIIKKYEHAIDYWISEPDSGISEAFNKGVTVSTGKWINFMNCGDRLFSKDACHIFAAHSDEKADIVFGKGNVVDNEGKIILTAGKVFNKRSFSRHMTIPHQSAFHHISYFQNYGLFDLSLKTSMVYELLLRKKTLFALFIDTVFSDMLAGGVHENEDYVRLREVKMIKRKYCSDISVALIEFDYWHGFVRAIIKRSLISMGLRNIVLKIRKLAFKFR